MIFNPLDKEFFRMPFAAAVSLGSIIVVVGCGSTIGVNSYTKYWAKRYFSLIVSGTQFIL
eukprot:UN23436